MKVSKLLMIGVLAVTMAGCTAASVLQAIAKWAPVGQAAFDGIVAIIAPKAAAQDQADIAAVTKAFQDLGTVTSNGTALSNLQAIVTGSEKVVADITPLLPANDAAYIQAGEAVLNTTIAVFEAQLGAPAPTTPTAINTPDLEFHTYIDGSYFVRASYDPEAVINYASAGQAAVAHPQAAKSKPPKLGDFKRQWNAVAKKHGHPEHQLKLTMAERLHLK